MPAPKQTKVKFPRAKATKIIKKVEKHIKPFVDRQMACGSYRRGAQMIGDIDFVVIPKEGVTLPQMLPPNEGINWVGDNKAQVVIDGEKVDFKVTTPEAWGATILYFTGPADFNIKYRWMAKKRGMKLNEYGLFDRNTDAYIAGATEQDIYDALKRPFRDPDQRTGWKRAEYQPNQQLSDYTPQSLMTSSAITGDYTVDSLKYGQTTLSSETTKFNFITGKEYTFDELPDDNAGRSSLREDAIHHFRSKEEGGYGFSGSHLNATYRAVIIPNKELVQRFGHLRGKSELQKNIEEHGLDYPSIGNEGNNRRIAMAKLGRDMPHLEIISAETFGSENQWIVDNLTLLLTQRARTLSELIDDLGIRGITVESNLVRLPNFVRVGKHVPAVWGLAGQDYNRKHPYNAISPAAGRKQHLKTMFEKLDPRELDWDDDVTWNQKNEPDWSDEVSWDAEGSTSRCPICFGFIPNNANPGAYPGALSRYDNATEICSACGQAEGMSGLFLGSVDKDKLADMETITDPWLRHTYLINLVKDVMPAAFRGE
jgi:hypothetical protein